MALKKYEDLLSNGLFFCALHRLDDKFEGCLTEQDFQHMINMKNYHGNSPDKKAYPSGSGGASQSVIHLAANSVWACRKPESPASEVRPDAEG
jgi:hypothetical protein